MTNKRDDFLKPTKETLSKRVGNICSNPQCNSPTWGPHSDSSKSINIGVAAHITAAKKGGYRFDSTLTSKQRKSIENGIWLCQRCSILIDRDEEYTIEEIKRWKHIAEKRAKKALNNPRIVNYGPDFAETILLCLIQKSNLLINSKTQGRKRKKITMKPIKADRILRDHKIPLLMGKIIESKETLFYLTCQNLGQGTDKDIKIDFKLNSKPLIKKIIIENPQRVQIVEGGRQSSSFVTLHIPTLLPGEMQVIKIITKKGAVPELTMSTQNSKNGEVAIYKYVFGEEEVVI